MSHFAELFNEFPPFEVYLLRSPLPVPKVQRLASRNEQRLKEVRSRGLKLPPVICHATYCLLQTWSDTGHGTLSLKSQKRGNENCVDVLLDYGMTHRYSLKQELSELQAAYEQIFQWIGYKMYHT